MNRSDGGMNFAIFYFCNIQTLLLEVKANCSIFSSAMGNIKISE